MKEEGKDVPDDLKSRAGPGNAEKDRQDQGEKDGQEQMLKNEVTDLTKKASATFHFYSTTFSTFQLLTQSVLF